MGRSVLVLNAGSSSLKYALYSVGSRIQLAVQGSAELIGSKNSKITHKVLTAGGAETRTEDGQLDDHKVALQEVVSLLHMSKSESKALAAVGHRVVHGGESITAPELITPHIKEAIERAIPLAPLHNPANLQGICVAEDLFGCPQVAVFDTAFHSTMLPSAFTYGIPYSLYRELGIRRYGFHGTSYLYLTGEAARMMQKPVEELNIIALHLGAGASVCAIKKGRCVDTSMGVTPLEGLVMATRSGDIDPAVCKILADLKGYSASKVDSILNKESGLFGICGEKDMRRIVQRAEDGDERSMLAFDVFVRRVRKYLGAYLVLLGGDVDAIVFSAGIGEHSAQVRKSVCEGLGKFGILIDDHKNLDGRKDAKEIQSTEGSVKVLVIPTDEELCIAQQTMKVVEKMKLKTGQGA